MNIYAVTLYGGYIGLIQDSSLEAANKQARSDQGSSNVQSVRLATEEEIKWVEAMGGPVPFMPTPKTKSPSEWAREGVMVMEGWWPKVGDHCDYYDRDGCKRQGTVTYYDGKIIKIDGEIKVIVKEEFTVRAGR